MTSSLPPAPDVPRSNPPAGGSSQGVRFLETTSRRNLPPASTVPQSTAGSVQPPSRQPPPIVYPTTGSTAAAPTAVTSERLLEATSLPRGTIPPTLFSNDPTNPIRPVPWGSPPGPQYANTRFTPYQGSNDIIYHLTKDVKLEVTDDGFIIKNIDYANLDRIRERILGQQCRIHDLENNHIILKDHKWWVKFITVVCAVLAALVIIMLIGWGLYNFWFSCTSDS